jgi:hypothetical protein
VIGLVAWISKKGLLQIVQVLLCRLDALLDMTLESPLGRPTDLLGGFQGFVYVKQVDCASGFDICVSSVQIARVILRSSACRVHGLLEMTSKLLCAPIKMWP